MLTTTEKHGVSRNELKWIERTEVEGRPGVWLAPVEFVGALLREAKQRNWKPRNLQLAVGNYGGSQNTELCGSFDVTISGDLPCGAKTPSLGFRLSNSAQHRPRIYVGWRLTQGGAAARTAELPSRSELLKNLDPMISYALDLWEIYYDEAWKIAEQLSQVAISESEAGALLLQAARAGIIPWSRLRIADDRFRVGEKTAWSLAVAFGAAAAKNTPLDQLSQISAFWGLLESACLLEK